MQPIQLTTFPLLVHPYLVHFQTMRYGGISTGEYASLNVSFSVGDKYENVMHNRQLIASAIGCDLKNFVFCRQIHSDGVYKVTENDLGRGADFLQHNTIQDVDALITNVPKAILCIKTADCLPVFIYAPTHRAVGIIHAGWRGTIHNIVKKTICQMGVHYGVRAEELIAVVGVGCGVCCYEVSEKVAEQFDNNYIYPYGNSLHLDLKCAIKDQLISTGVRSSNIHISTTCSICNSEDYFSSRAQKGAGGYGLAAIGLL